MNITLIVIVGAVVLIALFIWALYNGLVVARLRVKEAWSQIDVQLKRRADLIPNIVNTVKGYAKHEKTVFENVTRARSELMKPGTPAQKAQANNMLADALKTLFAVAENYPQLKASENFIALQKELSDTEDKVAYSRQFYNSSVLDYNQKIHIFPNMLFASMFGFTDEQFFEAKEGEREKVEVKFN